MAGMLYYPFIEAPRHVLVRALLYSDSLATIVPEQALDDAMDAFPRVIRDELPGFYSPEPFLRSDDYVDAWESRLPGVDVFTALRYLEQLITELSPDDLLVPRDAHRREFVLLHNKVGPRLSYWLREHGFAVRASQDELFVPAAVQYLVLSVMARYITAFRPDLRPHSDQRSAHNLATACVAGGGAQPFAVVDLGEVLPLPGPDTDLESIVHFRLRYEEERRRLVASVDRLVAVLKRSTPDSNALVQEVTDEVGSALRDFKHAGRRLNWRGQSVAALIGLGAAATGHHLVPEWSWLTNFLSSIGVNIATTRGTSIDPKVDVAYLHHIEQAIARS